VLLLGPLLRYVGTREATVWVEADRPCRVGVLGHEARTFEVEGHHYALVRIGGLQPGNEIEYDVSLDGARIWPSPDSPFPPPTIRALTDDHHRHRIAFGSCRLAMPDEPPYTLDPGEHRKGVGPDALQALARRALDDPACLPDLLLLLGDQVYVEEGAPKSRATIEERRDTTRPPGNGPADFEEYTLLYRESWSPPLVRWLLSTVPTAMVFDDHEVHDDWNISESWRHDIWTEDWWEARITGAYMSYWCYQHLGNLTPSTLDDEGLMRAAVAGGQDLSRELREAAGRWCRTTDGSRWSYCRDIGGSRLVVVDSRAGRVLYDGERDMLDDAEWTWLEEQLTGDVDHLVVASSLPILLLPALHHAETWSERVCDGAWGPAMARLGERIRRGADLEHWAAFDRSFRRLIDRLGDVAAGRRGRPPGSVVLVSGDVHHAYLARMAFRRGTGAQVPVVQLVSSPLRNPLPPVHRWGLRMAARPGVAAFVRLVARLAGAPSSPVRWAPTSAPIFDNQVATLTLDERRAEVVIEIAEPGADQGLRERLRERIA
jgi:hypothetical protein